MIPAIRRASIGPPCGRTTTLFARSPATFDAPLVDVYAIYHDWEKSSGRPISALLLDGMHPNDDGHKLLTDKLAPVVMDRLREPANR